MNSRISLSSIFLVLVLLLSACGPSYVAQAPYNPGYDPNSFYYDSVFPTPVYVGGVQGYYYGGVFRPMITLGGVYGFYDVGGRFHTSQTNRTVVINNYNTGREQYFNRTRTTTTASPVSTPGGYSKPDYNRSATPAYGSQAGGVTRGYQQQAPAYSKPAYGSQAGGVTRGYQQSAPTVSKPNYGSYSGGVTRSPSPSPSYSRPSSSSSSSSSSSRTSTRR